MTLWPQRFADFVARKEAEACAAVLSPFRTEVLHADPELVAIGDDWSRALFDGPFFVSRPPSPALPATNLVFVQSRNGNTGARNPSTLGGGDADKHLIYEGLSRVAADAVMTGARTIRGGNLVLSTWHPELVSIRSALGLPRHPIQVVATLGGAALDDDLMFNVPEVRVILVTVQDAVDRLRDGLRSRPWIASIVMSDSAGFGEAFRELRRRGVHTMSCIGGVTLARQLIDAGLIQDLYLTTSAIDAGDPETPLSATPLHGELVVRKHGTGADDGVVFEHTRLRSITGRIV